MSDDRLMERLREEAQALRYEPGEEVFIRLRARVRSRIVVAPPTVSQLLAGWLRPVGFALGALVVTVSLAVTIEQQRSHEANATIDTITASADTAGISEELLGVE
jgi:hypothetical protein